MSTKMGLPTAEEVKALLGVEFDFTFETYNGEGLDGATVRAYVAQADAKIGISIMGKLPDDADLELYGISEEDKDNDIILQCCNSCGDPDAEDYIDIFNKYVELIKSGHFRADNIHNVIDDGSITGGGGVEAMNDGCPFN